MKVLEVVMDLGGNYTTKNDFNISITNIISTMLACPDLETENELFNVLKTADNYICKKRYTFTQQSPDSTYSQICEVVKLNGILEMRS